MKKVAVLVEGHTEMAFVSQILSPYLINKGFQTTPILNKTSPGHAGGITPYSQFRRNLLRCARQDRLVTTMIDLFRLPADYPGMCTSTLDKKGIEQVKLLEEAMKENISIDLEPDRFIPYIQLHEFEALLFSDIEKMDRVLRVGRCSHLKELRGILDRYHTPENINTDKSPSMYIKNEYCRFKKASEGIIVAQKIGIGTMRRMCPHFNEWLTNIEEW